MARRRVAGQPRTKEKEMDMDMGYDNEGSVNTEWLPDLDLDLVEQVEDLPDLDL